MESLVVWGQVSWGAPLAVSGSASAWASAQILQSLPSSRRLPIPAALASLAVLLKVYPALCQRLPTNRAQPIARSHIFRFHSLRFVGERLASLNFDQRRNKGDHICQRRRAEWNSIVQNKMLAVAKNEGVLSPSASPRMTLKSDADVASALLALATGRCSEPSSIQTHATYNGHGAVPHMAVTDQVTSQSMQYGYYYVPMIQSGAGPVTQQPPNNAHPSIQSSAQQSGFSVSGSTTPGNRQSSVDNEMLSVQHNMLLDMSTTQFNRFLKRCQLDPDQIAELRKERRRKKNRLYAKRSRGKKLLRLMDEKSNPAASDKYSRIIIPELRPSQPNSESDGSPSSP